MFKIGVSSLASAGGVAAVGVGVSNERCYYNCCCSCYGDLSPGFRGSSSSRRSSVSCSASLARMASTAWRAASAPKEPFYSMLVSTILT